MYEKISECSEDGSVLNIEFFTKAEAGLDDKVRWLGETLVCWMGEIGWITFFFISQCCIYCLMGLVLTRYWFDVWRVHFKCSIGLESPVWGVGTMQDCHFVDALMIWGGVLPQWEAGRRLFNERGWMGWSHWWVNCRRSTVSISLFFGSNRAEMGTIRSQQVVKICLSTSEDFEM